MNDLLEPILNLFFPPRCVTCNTFGDWLCAHCVSQTVPLKPPVCHRCGSSVFDTNVSVCRRCQAMTLDHLDQLRSALLFQEGPTRRVVHFIKYNNHQAAAKNVAILLAEAYQRFQLTTDVIIPVPLHTSRLRQRGYNQSELLAKPLGKLLNQPVNVTALKRIKLTKSQVSLDRQARQTNVADAFTCQPDQLTEQTVLLIDDVCTTGATLSSCAKALKTQGGAKAVAALTLARAN